MGFHLVSVSLNIIADHRASATTKVSLPSSRYKMSITKHFEAGLPRDIKVEIPLSQTFFFFFVLLYKPGL